MKEHLLNIRWEGTQTQSTCFHFHSPYKHKQKKENNKKAWLCREKGDKEKEWKGPKSNSINSKPNKSNDERKKKKLYGTVFARGILADKLREIQEKSL